MTLDIADYKTEAWTVTQGVQDALRVLSAQIDKHVVPAFFETIQATAQDHIDITRTPFVGIIPAVDMTLAAAADKALLVGYDYAWYLTVQYVPADAFPPSTERITLEDTNPSETIETLLGGGSWATVTGIEPHQINNVDDWANIKKSFEFGDRCTRWKAIQEIADYCNFVFIVKWRDVAGTWRPCAYFVHEDDIDTDGVGLNLPAQITITEPDAYLMNGVYVKDSPEHQYNKVLVTGYDVATDTYFYAEAKKPGTEIPIEYVYADASLNTDSKTSDKAQELLDFFQASAKVYVARFKKRMDLELYQKINFVGYDKIGTDNMRITRIMYSRAAANDIVEIEFMKDQAIQQLRRLARAVNPDYVSGQQDMMNSDLSDIGLIDVFDDPVAGGTAAADLWEVPAALRPTDAVMAQTLMLDVRGMGIYNVCSISGRDGNNFGLWGYDTGDEQSVEFLHWDTSNGNIEILKDLYINNDPPDNRFPKIYFDVDAFRPTYLQGNRYEAEEGGFDGFSVVVGGTTMLKFTNPDDASEYLEVMRNLIINPNLIMGGSIKGYGDNNLVFWDNATGTKTLKQLSEGGGGEHTHSAADITSGTLGMVRGGTGNDHGDAESVGGYTPIRLIGTPTEIASGDCYAWTWYIDDVKAVIATPDLSYESEVACGNIATYVTKQEESNDEVTVWIYNGTGTSQYIGVRGVAFCY